MMAAMIARIALFLILLCVTAQAQQFGPAQFPIKDDDGDPMSITASAPSR
jgi:hypothetical protein